MIRKAAEQLEQAGNRGGKKGDLAHINDLEALVLSLVSGQEENPHTGITDFRATPKEMAEERLEDLLQKPEFRALLNMQGPGSGENNPSTGLLEFAPDTSDIASSADLASKGASVAEGMSGGAVPDLGVVEWLADLGGVSLNGLKEAFGFVDVAPNAVSSVPTAVSPFVGAGSSSAGSVAGGIDAAVNAGMAAQGSSVAGAAPFFLNPATMFALPALGGVISGLMSKRPPTAGFKRTEDGKLAVDYVDMGDVPGNEGKEQLTYYLQQVADEVNRQIDEEGATLPDELPQLSIGSDGIEGTWQSDRALGVQQQGDNTIDWASGNQVYSNTEASPRPINPEEILFGSMGGPNVSIESYNEGDNDLERRVFGEPWEQPTRETGGGIKYGEPVNTETGETLSEFQARRQQEYEPVANSDWSPDPLESAGDEQETGDQIEEASITLEDMLGGTGSANPTSARLTGTPLDRALEYDTGPRSWNDVLREATAPAETVITDAYADNFNRDPDEAGMAHWLANFDRPDFQYDFLAGATGGDRGMTLDGMYQEMFGRQADADGHEYWMNAPDFGHTLDAFLPAASQEDREARLNQIYQELFGRDIDDAGLEFWSGDAWGRGLADDGRIIDDILRSASGDDKARALRMGNF